MKDTKRNYTLLGILSFIVIVNILFLVFNPREIVEYIKVENSYLIVFIVAAIGGLSTLTGAALFVTIATFAAGGAEPLLLGLFGGIGIFISDSIFFHIAFYGRKAIPLSWENRIEKIKNWIEKHSERKVLTAAYLYMGFTPFPNDILMIALVIGGYSYKKIIGVVLAGSITAATVTAYIGNIFS